MFQLKAKRTGGLFGRKFYVFANGMVLARPLKMVVRGEDKEGEYYFVFLKDGTVSDRMRPICD